MNDEEIRAKVLSAVKESFEQDKYRGVKVALSLDTTFRDLDFDSLDEAQFAMYLSDSLGFELPDDWLSDIRNQRHASHSTLTLRDVIQYVKVNQESLRRSPGLSA